MWDKINLHICLMWSLHNSFHQTVKYGGQRNCILQALTGLEIEFSMKAWKPKNMSKPVCKKNRY